MFLQLHTIILIFVLNILKRNGLAVISLWYQWLLTVTFLFHFFFGVLGGKVKLSHFSIGFFNFAINVGVNPIDKLEAGFSANSEVFEVPFSKFSCLEALLSVASSFIDLTSHFSTYGEKSSQSKASWFEKLQYVFINSCRGFGVERRPRKLFVESKGALEVVA